MSITMGTVLEIKRKEDAKDKSVAYGWDYEFKLNGHDVTSGRMLGAKIYMPAGERVKAELEFHPNIDIDNLTADVDKENLDKVISDVEQLLAELKSV